jgi:hypothetical protein
MIGSIYLSIIIRLPLPENSIKNRWNHRPLHPIQAKPLVMPSKKNNELRKNMNNICLRFIANELRK